MKVVRDTRPIPSDDEIAKALAVLDRTDADEGTVDAALETMMAVSPAAVPSRDFARRAMLAVRQAPLEAGRRPLARSLPDWSRAAAIAVAAVAVAATAVAVAGPAVAYALARIIEFFVRAGVWVLASLNSAVRIFRTVVTVSAALADALASPAATTVLAVSALVSGLSLIALIRLLSTEQESSPWPDRTSPV